MMASALSSGRSFATCARAFWMVLRAGESSFSALRSADAVVAFSIRSCASVFFPFAIRDAIVGPALDSSYRSDRRRPRPRARAKPMRRSMDGVS
jgi:hypothetical protein